MTGRLDDTTCFDNAFSISYHLIFESIHFLEKNDDGPSFFWTEEKILRLMIFFRQTEPSYLFLPKYHTHVLHKILPCQLQFFRSEGLHYSCIHFE